MNESHGRSCKFNSYREVIFLAKSQLLLPLAPSVCHIRSEQFFAHPPQKTFLQKKLPSDSTVPYYHTKGQIYIFVTSKVPRAYTVYAWYTFIA